MSDIRTVALSLFEKHGVKLDCYKHDEKNYALKDMLQVYPDGVDGFTAEQIAAELQKIGDEVPDPPHPEWRVVWNTEDCTDGFDIPVGTSEEDAMEYVIGWYVNHLDFIIEDLVMRDIDPESEEYKDEFNYQISECYATLWRYDPEFVAQQSDHDLDKYYGTDCRDGWYEYAWVSDEEPEELGWKEMD